MFEFDQMCNAFEKMSNGERKAFDCSFYDYIIARLCIFWRHDF